MGCSDPASITCPRTDAEGVTCATSADGARQGDMARIAARLTRDSRIFRPGMWVCPEQTYTQEFRCDTLGVTQYQWVYNPVFTSRPGTDLPAVLTALNMRIRERREPKRVHSRPKARHSRSDHGRRNSVGSYNQQAASSLFPATDVRPKDNSRGVADAAR